MSQASTNSLLPPRTQPRIFAKLTTEDLVRRTKVSIRIGRPEGPTAVVMFPVLPVKSKWARENSGVALSNTATRRLGLASIRASRSWRPSNMVASTILKGGESNTTLQSVDVSSMTRTGAVDSAMIHLPFIDLDRARRRGDVLLVIGAHAGERRLGDAQFQEEVSFERQSLCQRRLGGVADEALDVSHRFRGV